MRYATPTRDPAKLVRALYHLGLAREERSLGYEFVFTPVSTVGKPENEPSTVSPLESKRQPHTCCFRIAAQRPGRLTLRFLNRRRQSRLTGRSIAS